MKYIFIIFLFPLLSCSQSPKLQPGELAIQKTSTTIEVDGDGTDPAWQQATTHSNFSYPWREEEAPSTSFKALWDDENFYFLYFAVDDEIITKIDTSLNEEMQAVNSDRVEIFFKSDDKMNPYYALEMDALGRVLDTEGRYYRDVDFDWDWPSGELVVKASKNETGYFVEGSISLESLRNLGMLGDDRVLQAGLYRGEYLTNVQQETKVKWISWIMPDSEKPDFHIPSSFGRLHLVE